MRVAKLGIGVSSTFIIITGCMGDDKSAGTAADSRDVDEQRQSCHACDSGHTREVTMIPSDPGEHEDKRNY